MFRLPNLMQAVQRYIAVGATCAAATMTPGCGTSYGPPTTRLQREESRERLEIACAQLREKYLQCLMGDTTSISKGDEIRRRNTCAERYNKGSKTILRLLDYGSNCGGVSLEALPPQPKGQGPLDSPD